MCLNIHQQIYDLNEYKNYITKDFFFKRGYPVKLYFLLTRSSVWPWTRDFRILTSTPKGACCSILTVSHGQTVEAGGPRVRASVQLVGWLLRIGR